MSSSAQKSPRIPFTDRVTAALTEGTARRIAFTEGAADAVLAFLADVPEAIATMPAYARALEQLLVVKDTMARLAGLEKAGQLTADAPALPEEMRAAMNSVVAAVGSVDVVTREYERLFSKSAAPLRNALFNLSGQARRWLRDYRWSLRRQIERNAETTEDSTGTLTPAAKMRRLRARRKLGFRMVSVPLHGLDLTTLRELGFITEAEAKNPGEVEAALQAFVVAALSTAGLALETEPARPSAANPSPLEVWVTRFADFIEAEKALEPGPSA